MKVSKRYATLFLLILVTEVAIAWFHFHRFIRGFLGDVLVIPLLYTLVRALTPFSWKKILLGVIGFAVLIETLQWFEIANRLGIEHKIIRIVLGNTFDPWDLVAYFLGFLLVVLTEFKNTSHE